AQLLVFVVVARDARVVADKPRREGRCGRLGRTLFRSRERTGRAAEKRDRKNEPHGLVALVHGECQLFDRVAGLAVLADLPAVLRLVLVVVTAKTARRIDVADI